MPHYAVNDGYKITLVAYFDDTPTDVEISFCKYGGSVWHVLLNRRYHGRVWHSDSFGWTHDIRPDSLLSYDDITTVIDLITAHVGPPD